MISTLPVDAQQHNYARSTLRALIRQKEKTQDSISSAGTTTKAIPGLGIALIRFYQYFISSQDRPSCMFSKSCSNFALSAINTNGYILGIMMTADRLQRCHELGHGYYRTDPSTHLAIDPVFEYFVNTVSDKK